MTERFSILLNRSEVDSVIPELLRILEDVWPSAHFTEAPGHHCHKTQLFASHFFALQGHHRLDVDVLWSGISCEFIIDLVGVGNLHEEAATLCEMDPEFRQILVLERVWLDGLEVLGVKLRAWKWVHRPSSLRSVGFNLSAHNGRNVRTLRAADWLLLLSF